MNTHFRIIAASCIMVLVAPLGALADTTSTPPDNAPAVGIRMKMRYKNCSKLRRQNMDLYNACRKERVEYRQSILKQRRELRTEIKDNKSDRRGNRAALKALDNERLNEARKHFLDRQFNANAKRGSALHRSRSAGTVERRRAWREQKQNGKNRKARLEE